MTLDPDDPRPPYQQVAARLRAAILTKSVAPGERLASGPELAKQYGVARMTIQQAMRLLRDEGLVVSRQGSGVFVRARTERPVGLRPHIEDAFRSNDVAIDFAGLSGETLAGALAEPLDQVRAGVLAPRSIAVRLLVPDPTTVWTLPGNPDGTDNPAFRRRAEGILARSADAVAQAVDELRDMGLIEEATAQVRYAVTTPTFKVYVLNGRDCFFGLYPAVPRSITLDGTRTDVVDLMGKDSTLFHYTRTTEPDSIESQHVDQAAAWFESMWQHASRARHP